MYYKFIPVVGKKSKASYFVRDCEEQRCPTLHFCAHLDLQQAQHNDYILYMAVIQENIQQGYNI